MAKSNQPSRSRTADPTALGRRFKKSLRSDRVLLGGIVQEYVRPSLVKLYRHAGFDFIFVETEHMTALGPEMSDFIQSARDNGLPVVAKIGQLERAETCRLLDAGVAAIQLPRTGSREQLVELLDYMKFPPQGTRAGAPCFGNVDYVAPSDDRGWLRKANGSTALVAHIETEQGFTHAEEIITTPGLDAVYVGPYDFSIAMGAPGEYDDPRVKRAMRRILDLCVRHGVAFGTTASGSRSATQWVRAGCRFFEVVDELTLISSGACDVVDAYRGIGPTGGSSKNTR